MKTWVVVILLLFIILPGSAAIIVYQKGFPTEWTKQKIISCIEQRMNAHVRIDDVSFGFPNRLIVTGLSVMPLQTGTAGSRSAVSGQQSAGSRQQSAVSGQQAVASSRQAAGSNQQAAVSSQQSAGSNQQPAVSGQQSAGSGQQSAVSSRQAVGGQQSASGSRQAAGGQQSAGSSQQAADGQQSAVGSRQTAGGQQSAVGSRQAAGGQQSAVDGRQAAGGQQSTVGRQQAAGGQQSAVGRQQAASGQQSAVGRQQAAGGQQSAVGRQQAASGQQSAVGRQQAAGSSRQAAVEQQSAVGSRQAAEGSRRSAVSSRQSAVSRSLSPNYQKCSLHQRGSLHRPLLRIKQVVVKCRLRDLILKSHPSSYGIDTVTILSPDLYLSRSRDGVWNTEGIFKPGPGELKSHAPPGFSLFCKGGRITIEDGMYGTINRGAAPARGATTAKGTTGTIGRENPAPTPAGDATPANGATPARSTPPREVTSPLPSSLGSPVPAGTYSVVLSRVRLSYAAGRFEAKALGGGIEKPQAGMSVPQQVEAKACGESTPDIDRNPLSAESLTPAGAATPLHFSGIIHTVSPIDMSWEMGVKKTNLAGCSPYLKLPFGQVLDGDVWIDLRGRASYHPSAQKEEGALSPSSHPSPQWEEGVRVGEYAVYGLSGQIGVQDGRFLLKNARLPFNQINGVFRLTSDSRGTKTQLNPHLPGVLPTGEGGTETQLSLRLPLFSRTAEAAQQKTDRLTGPTVTTLRADNLRATLCDTAVKTTIVIPDINNPATILQFETSRFDASTLRYLTNIDSLRGYFSRLKLKTSLKFDGRITPSPLAVEGRLKTNNLLGKKQFSAEAGFIFRDDAFDSIDINIDGKTKVRGRICFSSCSSQKGDNPPLPLPGGDNPPLPTPRRGIIPTTSQGRTAAVSSSANTSDLTVECSQARVSPLLGLAGIKGTPELENGNISGRLRIRPDNCPGGCLYEGNLGIDTGGEWKRAELTLNGQRLEAVITQPEGGSVTASCQWLSGLKVDASVRDFTWNHANYSFDAVWDTTVEDSLAGGEITANNVSINHIDYPAWHGRLSCREQTLRIDSPQSQKLLINGEISMKKVDLDINVADLRLDILNPALDGTADGRIQLTGDPLNRLAVSGQGISIRNNSLICRDSSPTEANLFLTKRNNMISISSISFTQAGEGRAYVSGLVTTSDRGISSVSLNTQITNLNINNVRATATAKYSGHAGSGGFKANIVLAKGCIGGLNISSGRLELRSRKNGSSFSGNICAGDKGVFKCSGGWDSSFLTSDFTLKDIDFNELPFDYFSQWHGSAVLQGRLEGQIKNPYLSANFISSNLNIGGKDVKNLSGSLSYISHRLSVDANFDNEILFFGMLGEETKARIRIEKGRLSLLSRVLKLPPARLNGLINGELNLTGKMDNPSIDGDVTVEGFESYGVAADIIKVKVNIKNRVFSSSQLYCQQDGDTRLIVNKCMFELVPDGKISVEARANSFQAANITLSGTVSCNGSITVGKSASCVVRTSNIVVNDSYDLKNLAVLAKFLNDESLEFIQQPAENSILGKIRFASKDRIVIENFSLLRQGKKILEIAGETDLSTKKMDIGIIMKNADLALLSLYMPTIKKAEGVVDGSLCFGGLLNEPEINGSLKLSGDLNTYPFAARIRDMAGEIRVVNNSFILQNLSANIGKGRLIAESKGAFTLSDMNISIRSEGAPIPILIPEFIESHGRYGGIEMNMNISGHVSSPHAAGQVSLTNTDFTYPPKKTKTTPAGFFNSMSWDVMIIGKDNIRYYNDYTNICLKKNAWLRVVKNDEQLELTGKVFAREGGLIDYLGTEFILKEGCLEFRENEPGPYLSATAWARLNKRKIILSHQGYVYKTDLVLNATGYPPLTQEEIIKLLIGRGNEAVLNQGDLQTLISVASGQILGKRIPDAILLPIERRISRFLRIDLEVKTPVMERMLEESLSEKGTSSSSASIFAKTSIKIGKFIQENVYISYKGVLNPRTDEGDIAVQSRKMRLENEIGLEYYLSGNTTIKYKFIPRYNQLKDEYEVSLERGLRF